MKIIVFEGLDCSYKETNSKKLVEYLKSKSVPVIFQSFPRYDNQSSYFVRRYLNNEYSISTLESTISYYMLDQSDWWNDICNRTDITSDTIIVLDRFYTSNSYYLNKNSINKLINLDDIRLSKMIETVYYKKINEIRKYFGLPSIDIIIKMYSDSNKLKEKSIQRGNKLDIYEEDDKYMKGVAKVFNISKFAPFMNTEKSSILEIYTENRTREKIFNEIINKLKKEGIDYV